MDPRALPNDIEALKALVLQLGTQHHAQLAQRDERMRILEHAVHVLTTVPSAPESERRPAGNFQLAPAQMHLLFPELIEAAERVADEKRVQGDVEQRTGGQKRMPKRRREFPPHLPVIRSIFELLPDQRGCTCGSEMTVIESQAKAGGFSHEQLRALRQKESLPRLAKLQDWMTATRPKVFDKGDLAKAINYIEANWAALCRYCDDGRLDIDNNAAERALRTIAVGRKNWICFGNERGGEAAAVMYSLIATCKEHDVDPRTYLRDVLLRISKVSDVSELTPYGWKAKWAPAVENHRANILERFLDAARV